MSILKVKDTVIPILNFNNCLETFLNYNKIFNTVVEVFVNETHDYILLENEIRIHVYSIPFDIRTRFYVKTVNRNQWCSNKIEVIPTSSK